MDPSARNSDSMAEQRDRREEGSLEGILEGTLDGTLERILRRVDKAEAYEDGAIRSTLGQTVTSGSRNVVEPESTEQVEDQRQRQRSRLEQEQQLSLQHFQILKQQLFLLEQRSKKAEKEGITKRVDDQRQNQQLWLQQQLNLQHLEIQKQQQQLLLLQNLKKAEKEGSTERVDSQRQPQQLSLHYLELQKQLQQLIQEQEQLQLQHLKKAEKEAITERVDGQRQPRQLSLQQQLNPQHPEMQKLQLRLQQRWPKEEKDEEGKGLNGRAIDAAERQRGQGQNEEIKPRCCSRVHIKAFDEDDDVVVVTEGMAENKSDDGSGSDGGKKEDKQKQKKPAIDTECTHQIAISETEEWTEDVLACEKNRLAMLALSNNDINSILKRPSTVIADTDPVFNIRIPIEGNPVTNQQRSGRCWLFASTNVFRVAIMKAYKLDSFQLSQAYLFFWDKLEKANYFLESILKTVDEPLDGRLLGTLMASPVGDGGQWDMVANLVDKYGLVPHSIYPDQQSARNSSSMDRLLTSKLRASALKLRNVAQQRSGSDVAAVKTEIMQDIHRILIIMLGPPPAPDKHFTWTFCDKDGALKTVKQTPRKFASELSDPSVVKACNGTDVNSLFSLVNDPRNEYWQLLSVDWLGNVYEGRSIRYANVPMKTMKNACIAMLRAGHPVFFGCDVGKSSESSHGIMDVDLFDYGLGFNVKIDMNKCQRLSIGESQMTHAMVLTGVHVEDGKSVRWRVENSWSKSAGTDGYFVMTDKWMDEFVYQAVVAPSFVDVDVRNILLQKPKVLPLWDPMGALA